MEFSDIVISPIPSHTHDLRRRPDIPISISPEGHVGDTTGIKITPEYDAITNPEIENPKILGPENDKDNREILIKILNTLSEIKDILTEDSDQNSRRAITQRRVRGRSSRRPRRLALSS